MQPAILFSMAGFALASSITPGPVNLVALNSGLRFGGRATLPHVTGATIGFTLLLALIGLGLAGMLEALPAARNVIAWSGALFILWQAVRLWLAPGLDDTEGGDAATAAGLAGRLDAMAESQGLDGLDGGNEPVWRQWMGADRAVRRSLLRHLLGGAQLLGLCRRLVAT